MARIGVALSGGGHRAALFGLGALLYLADAGKSREIVSIASVSGGSLTNAYLAQRLNLAAASRAEVRRVAGELASQIAQRGTVWRPLATKLYLAGLILALAFPVGAWWLPWPWPGRLAASLGGLLVWGLFAQQRGLIGGHALGKTLFSPGGRPGLLRDLHSEIDHVICATDIYPGEHVYFSGKFVCSYRLGWGHPHDMPVHQAVMASAALPGAFPVQWHRTGRHAFEGGQVSRGWMALVDGGAYDNMADQWGQGIEIRKGRWPQADGLESIDTFIVVNASAGLDETELAKLRIPFLGEILALLRDIDVLYDNSTSLRRKALFEQFESAELQGKGLKGCMVHIPRSPHYVPNFYKESDEGSARRARAEEAVTALAGEPPAAWDPIVNQNQRAKTSLSKMGTEATARLLRHGFVLAMMNLHVILEDYPLLPLPAMSEFESLARGEEG